MPQYPAASVDANLEVKEGSCVLTYEPLNTNHIISSVGDDKAGAIACFIGTTRDSFKGKTVIKLEYQAYSDLAIKTLASILVAASERSSQSQSPHDPSVKSLIRCAVHHRLGEVPVGQPSIVIAVSSPHRREAFEACEFILEEVKLKAQIWKREYYKDARDEDAEWKANNA